MVGNEKYDGAISARGDFERGEWFIARIYEALRAQPDVFEKSIFVIVYDEHGGLYDHVAPPTHVTPPGGRIEDRGLWKLLHALLRKRSKAFDFTMLGVRVPAVVVSPFVPEGHLDSVVRATTPASPPPCVSCSLPARSP